MLSPTSRLPDLERLIAQESYFVIHAPRQTGKTTAMIALAKQLTSSGRYTAVMVSAEVGAPFSHDPGAAELSMLDAWWASVQFDLPSDLHPSVFWDEGQPGRLMAFLHRVVNGGGTLEREYAIGRDPPQGGSASRSHGFVSEIWSCDIRD